jgi:hypothetical protein
VSAVAGRLLVFPFGCWNNDEAVYQLQAASLVGGRFFPIAPSQGDSAMTPWLSVLRDGNFVPKYSPISPAFYAVGDALRIPLVSFALVGALAVIGIAGLTRALGGSRAGVAAALTLVVMPVFLMQSWTALSYLPTLTISLYALWAGVVATKRASWGYAAAAGLLAGLVAFARPLDGAIVAVVLLFWFMTELRNATRVRAIAAAGGALAIVGAAMLAYNAKATGNAFTLPFNILDRTDSWGLGDHRLLPGAQPFDFNVGRMFEGAGRNLMLVLIWAPGSLLGVLLAVRALRNGRLDGRRLLLLWAGLTFVAYAFFWGSYHATVTWGATNYLGPYYFLPVMTVVAIAAGAELSVEGWPLRRAAMVGVVVLSVIVVAVALPTNLDTTTVLREVDTATASARDEKSLVIVDPIVGDFLNTPYGTIGNDPELTDSTLYALGNHGAVDAQKAAGADRQLWMLRFGVRPTAVSTDLAPRLERAKVVRGDNLELAAAHATPEVVEMRWGTCVLTRSSKASSVAFDITAEGLAMADSDTPDRCPPVDGTIVLTWGEHDDVALGDRHFVPVQVDGQTVTAIVEQSTTAN